MNNDMQLRNPISLRDVRQAVAALYAGQRVQPSLEAVLFDMAGGGAQGFKRAAILARSIYWSDKEKGKWWYKTDADWEFETRIKRVSSHAKALAICGLESETKPRKGGTSPTRHYRLDAAAFIERLAAVLKVAVEKLLAALGCRVRTVRNGQFELSETDNSNCENPTGENVEIEQVELSESSSLVPSVLESDLESGEESEPPGVSHEEETPPDEATGSLESAPEKGFWESAFLQLELQLDRASFDTYCRGAKFLRLADGAYVIGIPRGDFAVQMCQHRLYRLIERLLMDVSGGAVRIVFEKIAASKLYAERPPWATQRSA